MKKIIVTILIVSGIFAQNINNVLSQEFMDSDKNSIQSSQDLDLTSNENLTYTPIEKTINPDTYILGPGDLLGINIISTTNISIPIRVNPIGEILIPSVGVLNINSLSLTDARIRISDYVIRTALKNAIVNVTLLDIRRFKVQVLGAVYNPGYIYISPIDKIYDAVLLSGGVQKFAHPEIVQVIRGESIIKVKLKEYISGNDLSQNISEAYLSCRYR